MTGASKLTHRDIIKIRELFNEGYNNTQIARMYKPIKGDKVSRIHISSIRRNKSWNFDIHSFIAKEHLPFEESIITTLGNDTYKTDLAYIISKYGNYHVFMTFKNETFKNDTDTPLMLEKPLREDILKYHNKWVYDEVSGV